MTGRSLYFKSLNSIFANKSFRDPRQWETRKRRRSEDHFTQEKSFRNGNLGKMLSVCNNFHVTRTKVNSVDTKSTSQKIASYRKLILHNFPQWCSHICNDLKYYSAFFSVSNNTSSLDENFGPSSKILQLREQARSPTTNRKQCWPVRRIVKQK